MNLLSAKEKAKQQKQKAMDEYESKEGFAKQDASQAIIAWDEVLGQLHKPNGVKQKHLERAKKIALRITKNIANPSYREEVETKIKKLELDD